MSLRPSLPTGKWLSFTMPEAAKYNLEGIFAGIYADLKQVEEALSGAYTKPEDGIPKTDLAEAVQTSLEQADSAYSLASKAVQGDAKLMVLRGGKIQLNGGNPTPIAFRNDTAAEVTSTNAGPFDLTGVGSGGTIIINPDGAGNKTATINFTQGNSVSDAGATEDISGESDNKFMISVDGDEAEEIELDLTECTTGANTAAEMEAKIKAKGGKKADVTVTWNAGTTKYTVTSGSYGRGSSVVITNSEEANIAEELKLGVANDGEETAGTGPVEDASAATSEEMAAVIDALDGLSASVDEDGKIVVVSDTTGRGSSLVIDAGTLNDVIGFTNANSYYGAQGLGYETDMADDAYLVAWGLNGTAKGSLADRDLSANNRATTGFDLVCETDAATDYVDVLIFGIAAS